MPNSPTILSTDRLLFVGMTDSGKTFLADKLLRGTPRVVVVDSKPSPSIRAWGLADWSAKTRRLLSNPTAPCRLRIPCQYEDAEYDAIFHDLFYDYQNYVLYVDEINEATSLKGTRDFRRLYKQGRENGIGVWGGTQEPIFLPSVCTSQAEWLILFTLPVGDHRERMAKTGMGKTALTPLKKHWYYLYRQGWEAPLLCPPWPAPPIRT